MSDHVLTDKTNQCNAGAPVQTLKENAASDQPIKNQSWRTISGSAFKANAEHVKEAKQLIHQVRKASWKIQNALDAQSTCDTASACSVDDASVTSITTQHGSRPVSPMS